MSQFPQQIADICKNASLGVRDTEVYGKFYQKYKDSFETLLKEITHNKPELQSFIHEIVNAVYSVHELVLDEPQQEESQIEKLQNYIEKLVKNVQNDPNYLRHWTMQSIVDDLFSDSALQRDQESTDDFIARSNQELENLEEQLELEKQKIQLTTEIDLDDDDKMDKELENILHLSSVDMEAGSTTHFKHIGDDISDTTTRASSSSTESNLSDSMFVYFAEKFHKIMADFQAQTYPSHLKSHDRVTLENYNDKIAENVMSLYTHSYQKGITDKTINEFEQSTQAMITHSSWKKNVSPNAAPYLAQPLAKLTLGLHNLLTDMRKSLDSDDEYQERSDTSPKV